MKESRGEQQQRRTGAEVQRSSHLSSSAPVEVSLSRGAVVIGLVSFLADISSEMIYPILPVFLTQTLRAPATVVGLIEGIANGTASIISGISGWISDRVGRRKPVAFVGYVLTAVSRPMIALAAVWPVVLAARFFDRLGRGVRVSPRDALLAEVSAEEHRGRAFGYERAMDSAGAVLGPLIGLALVAWAGIEHRKVFLISAIPASLAALMILTVREQRDDFVEGGSSARLTFAGTTREYRRFLIVTGVFGLANSANAFLILRARQVGLTTGQTILAYALFNAVAAIASMPAGSASDRLGRRNLLIAGYSIYAISYAGLAAAGTAWLIWPLFALYGLFPALTDGVSKALAVDTAGNVGRGTAIGIYSAVVGITQIAASYIGGVLWDKIDPRATFYFGAALAALSVAMLLVLLPSRAAVSQEEPHRSS